MDWEIRKVNQKAHKILELFDFPMEKLLHQNALVVKLADQHGHCVCWIVF